MYVLAYSRYSTPASEVFPKATRVMVTTEDRTERAQATKTEAHRSRSDTILLPQATVAYCKHRELAG